MENAFVKRVSRRHSMRMLRFCRSLAYAWSHEGDDGRRHYVAVLGVPPVNIALDAVRVLIVAEAQKARE